MAVGLIPGVLDGGRVPPIDTSSGETSWCERFLELLAGGVIVIGEEAGTGMGSGD